MSENRVITDEIRATLERDERLPHPTEVAVLRAARHGDAARGASAASISVKPQ